MSRWRPSEPARIDRHPTRSRPRNFQLRLGHALRSNTVWEKTKQAFAQSGVTMTFELVKAYALSKGRELLGLSE